MRVGVAVGVALLVLLTVVALQNTDEVVVRFLLWRFSVPTAVLVYVALVVGVVAGWLLHGFRRRRRRAAERRSTDREKAWD